MAIDLQWREDHGSAVVLHDGTFVGTLSVEQWWTEPWGDPSPAWVAGFLNPASGQFVQNCVEVPALQVDGGREQEMLVKTRDALASSPASVPGPSTEPAPAKFSADDVHAQLERVITAWADALNDLWRVGEQRDPSLSYSLYIKLVHVLNWAYTVDQALQAAWNRVPPVQQVAASQDADAKLVAALKDRESRENGANEGAEDALFKPFFRRSAERRPYRDWASVVVAGAFHEEFFGGLNWISGKMRHEAAGLPIELRQMQNGGEPRWKWKLASAIAPEGRDGGSDQREMFVSHLQGHDVLGLFSWLVDVFVDARLLIVQLLRETE